MPAINAGYAQANHLLTLGTDPEPMMVTMGIKFDTVVFDDLGTIANDLHGAFNSSWDQILSDAYSINKVVLYANLGGTPVVAESTVSPIAFDITALPLPQNCAALVKKVTTFGTRLGRGRCYVPGLAEANVNANGTYVGTLQADLQSAATSWLGAINAVSGVDHAVLLHTDPAISPYEIAALTVDSRIATQRRRLR